LNQSFFLEESELLQGLLKTSLAVSAAVDLVYTSGLYSRERKADSSHLTGADLLANRLCLYGLMKILPDAGWLSEETPDDELRLGKEDVWIVDPIDGTREFVHGIGEFSVSIGLSRKGSPVLGAIGIPAEGILILGGEDHGVFQVSWDRNIISDIFKRHEFSESIDPASFFEIFNESFRNISGSMSIQKKTISKVISLQEASVHISRTEWERGNYEAIKNDLHFLKSGSVARKLGILSAGTGDLVVSLNHKNEWDICGGTALVKAAGGMVLDLDNFQEKAFNQKNPRSLGLVAGNPEIVRSFTEYCIEKNIKLEG